jgi:hypothetical protein
MSSSFIYLPKILAWYLISKRFICIFIYETILTYFELDINRKDDFMALFGPKSPEDKDPMVDLEMLTSKAIHCHLAGICVRGICWRVRSSTLFYIERFFTNSIRI